MDVRTDYAKTERRFLGAFLACLLAMAMAWTGFYTWCRVTYGMRYVHYEGGGVTERVFVTVPPGVPDWVDTAAQKTVSLEELVRGEKFPGIPFTMGETF